MGLPTPQEAAPPYDHVVHNHPLSRFTQLGSSSGYAAVPQEDDVEQHAHDETAPTPASSSEPETIAQTIASVFRPKPHVHCETCDAQLERRERRANEKSCCAMVAWVFITLFFSGMVLGIVIANNAAKSRRH